MVIDSNIFIDHLRAKDKSNTELFKISNNLELFVCTTTIYELFIGTSSIDKKLELDMLISKFHIYDFNKIIALEAANIYNQLKKKNQLIEFRDIFIAATCIVNNKPLLTRNKKHFSRIENLKLVDLET